MSANKTHELPDVDGDMLAISTGEGVLGAHKGAIVEFSIVGPWCPNAEQFRTLRNLCSKILASHLPEAVILTAKDESLRVAVDSLRDGLVADRAGNICLLDGKVVATGDPDEQVWRERIVEIVNAVGDAYVEDVAGFVHGAPELLDHAQAKEARDIQSWQDATECTTPSSAAHIFETLRGQLDEWREAAALLGAREAADLRKMALVAPTEGRKP